MQTAGKQVISKQVSKGPVIATIYKPPGEPGKPKERPYGEFEEDFVYGKPLAPKPSPKRYIPIEAPDPGRSYRPPKQPKPIKAYGQDSPDMEEFMAYFSEWAKKLLKGEKGVQVDLVFLPEYRRN